MRAIDRVLRAAQFRDRYEIEQQWALRIDDLQEALLRFRPDIVHFSGHGTESSEIVVQDGSGAGHAVPRDALGRLFSVLRDNIRCVVLNACYSEPQAQAIADHIDCVVGMTSAVEMMRRSSSRPRFTGPSGTGGTSRQRSISGRT